MVHVNIGFKLSQAHRGVIVVLMILIFVNQNKFLKETISA